MEPGTETTTRGAAASLGSALSTDGEQEPGSGYCWTTRLVPAWGHHCAAQRGPAAKPPGCEIWHVRGVILPRRQPRAPGRALWDAQTAAGMRRAGKHSISVPAACGGTACLGRGERSECPGASPAGLVLLCAAATAQGTPDPPAHAERGQKEPALLMLTRQRNGRSTARRGHLDLAMPRCKGPFCFVPRAPDCFTPSGAVTTNSTERCTHLGTF